MSLGRRRNVYTLGDFQTKLQETDGAVQQHHLRRTVDPFERDPFKIHSYNFHYADRPIYPVEQFVPPTPNPAVTKPFNTVFYNYDFATHRADKENTSTNTFHEYRRRKYLQDYQTTTANVYGSNGINYCNTSNNNNTGGDEQQTVLWEQELTTSPPTMHQLQYQPPCCQYPLLQQEQQQQQLSSHKSQQHCERQEITVFGATRIANSSGSGSGSGNTGYSNSVNQEGTTTNIRAGTAKDCNMSNFNNNANTTVTTNGRSFMPNYPSSAHTLTSLYQRDTTNRDRLSRLYGFPTGPTRSECEQTAARESSGIAIKANNRTTTGSGSSGGIGYSAAKATTAFNSSGSRTSLGSLRARSPAGRGQSPTNGCGSGVGHHAGILTDKTNRNTAFASASNTSTGMPLDRCERQQRNMCLPGISSSRCNEAINDTTYTAPARRSRGSVQVIHAPAQAVVNVPLEAKRSSSSGCRININIKNGDETMTRSSRGTDNNVTIKIETDVRSNKSVTDMGTNGLRNSNLYYASNSPLRHRFSSPGRQNYLGCSQSNETLIIDKHISKFSIVNEKTPAKEKRRSHSSAPFGRRLSEQSVYPASREQGGAWTRDSLQTSAELKADLAKRHRDKDLDDRMPSLLPWRLRRQINDYYDTGDGANGRKSPRSEGDSSSSLQRARNSYNACIKDLINLKKFNNEQLAALANKPQSPRASLAERKLINTINGGKRSGVHNSTYENIENRKLQPMKALPASLDGLFSRSSQQNLHHRKTSSVSTATQKSSHHSLCQTTPLKVNINVYTDKLKLLRI